MIKTFLAVCFASIVLSCNNAKNTQTDNGSQGSMNNTLSNSEKKEGWKLLFDGSSLNGWHKYGTTGVGPKWSVKDNSIFLDASVKGEGGDIVTDEEYDNFDLKLEWKVDSGANSGIIIFIYEDKAKFEWPYQTGPEMQVLDNQRHPDAKIIKHRAGDLYDLISSSKETVKPALEWNEVEIKSLNGKLDFFLNGENIVSTTMWDDNWKNLISKSKFKNMEGFGTYRKGKIGLQDHGDKVWYRNIRIRKL